MSAPRRAALFGKLPAHGDFVRRGDAGLARRLDGWLTGEVERLAAAGPDGLDPALAVLPTWCFALADGLAGALAARADRVGRVFPLVACAEGVAADEVAAALLATRDGRVDADGLHRRLAEAAWDDGADARQGWWQADGTAALDERDLPTGPAFARLLAGAG